MATTVPSVEEILGIVHGVLQRRSREQLQLLVMRFRTSTTKERVVAVLSASMLLAKLLAL